jgi:DNA-binding beta-propeller fold protein YncE
MSPGGTEVYVVDRDGIAVICASTGMVFERITVDARPSCIALNSALSRLYVAARGPVDIPARGHTGAVGSDRVTGRNRIKNP